MKPLSAVLLILLLIGQPGSRWAREEGGAVKLGPERDIFGDDDDDDDDDNDDDDEEEEEEETNMIPGSRDKVPLQCYFCQVLHTGENCNQIQNCSHSEAFCTTLISHSNTDKGLLVTHSMWCADTCRPIIKTVEGTQVTQTCCQSTLCNILPWQSPQIQNPLGGRANRPLDGGARHPQNGSAGNPLDGGARHPQGGRVDHPQVIKAARPRSDGTSLPKGGGKANRPQGSGAGCPSGWTKFGNIALLLSFFTCLWASGA